MLMGESQSLYCLGFLGLWLFANSLSSKEELHALFKCRLIGSKMDGNL